MNALVNPRAGDKLCYHEDGQIRLLRIAHVTPTQVVLSNTQRFYIANGLYVGKNYDPWRSHPWVTMPTADDVRQCNKNVLMREIERMANRQWLNELSYDRLTLVFHALKNKELGPAVRNRLGRVVESL